MAGSWTTTEVSPRYFQVEHGGQVVGAIIARSNGEWVVGLEHGGYAIRSSEFGEYRLALAFVEGVEKTLAAMEKAS